MDVKNIFCIYLHKKQKYIRVYYNMSQSDYLKYKRVATELKINKLDPIFKPEDYVSYKEFYL